MEEREGFKPDMIGCTNALQRYSRVRGVTVHSFFSTKLSLGFSLAFKFVAVKLSTSISSSSCRASSSHCFPRVSGSLPNHRARISGEANPAEGPCLEAKHRDGIKAAAFESVDRKSADTSTTSL